MTEQELKKEPKTLVKHKLIKHKTNIKLSLKPLFFIQAVSICAVT